MQKFAPVHLALPGHLSLLSALDATHPGVITADQPDPSRIPHHVSIDATRGAPARSSACFGVACGDPAEKDCLSAVSALGYQHVFRCDAVVCEARNTQYSNPSLIILPGARTLSLEYASELRERMSGGTWVILESGLSFAGRTESAHQADVYRKAFGLRLLPLINTTHHTAGLSYIEYVWPLSSLVRTFEAIAPVVSEPSDVIARFGEHFVCARKIFGRGGLIYLGSMLGPGLFAEEREAQAVAAELLSLVCDDARFDVGTLRAS